MITIFRNLFAPPRDLILVVAAIWAGLYLAEKRSKQFGINDRDLNNITFFPLIGYLIGGRILFAVENISAFTKNPESIFSLNLDLFDPAGGMAVALIVALIYGQKRKMPLWSTLDALTPLMAVFFLGLGLAHLASGSGFGKETNLPWGIYLWGANRHPSQVYEILASLIILGIIWFQKTTLRPGIYFLQFSALSSGFRLFLEAFRGDSTLLFGSLRADQIISWIILLVSLIYLDKFNKEIQKDSTTRSIEYE